VVGEHHNAHAGLLCRGQNLGAGAFRVVGILGVNVDDRSEILERADFQHGTAGLGELLARLMCRLESGWLQALLRGEPDGVGFAPYAKSDGDQKRDAPGAEVHPGESGRFVSERIAANPQSKLTASFCRGSTPHSSFMPALL
jgi:hypothetical protein